MSRVLPLLMAFCLLSVAAVAEQGDLARRHAPLLDPGGDRIVRRAWVPDAERPQGEVRLIRRGEAQVMQTVLFTKVPQRVVYAIIEKELSAWPEGREGAADSLGYREDLKRALREVQRHGAEHPRPDRRLQLLIEFVMVERAAFYAFFRPEVFQEAGGLGIASRELLIVEEASPVYVGGNLVEIARDSFHLEREEAEKLIASQVEP